MIGFPKTLNTKEDYLYVKEHFAKEEWLPWFQRLLDTANDWFFVRNLEQGETVETTETQKIIEGQIIDEKKQPDALYEYRENPTCTMYRLGFTREEVETIVAEAAAE